MRVAGASLALSMMLVHGLGCCTEEPRYRGKPLSHWVAQLDDKDPQTQVDALEAMRRFGADAESSADRVNKLWLEGEDGVRDAAPDAR